MKILVSHPTGNANVRAALHGIVEADILASFHTSIATFPGSILGLLSTLRPFMEFQRREFEQSLRKATVMHTFKEVGRMVALKVGLPSLTKHETGFFSIDAVYNYIDKQVANSLAKSADIEAVYAYEDGALESFKAAKKLGITCLYDLPIGYWRSARLLLDEERNRRPDWAVTLTGFNDSVDKLAGKDLELSLADHIFVASSFTAKTLKNYAGDLAPISIIPYGFPPVADGRTYPALHKRVLKLLFVGGLSQRKGIANLLDAVKDLRSHVSLTIVGHKAVENCKPLNEALNTHTWIPSLPHNQILQLMQQHDVLIFPSLFEGFGLVISEAMSQGTPVITTERTAGPDIIDHEHNGWLIRAGSTEDLKHAIEAILLKPQIIEKLGKAAIEKARGRSWEVYGNELAATIKKLSKNK